MKTYIVTEEQLEQFYSAGEASGVSKQLGAGLHPSSAFAELLDHLPEAPGFNEGNQVAASETPLISKDELLDALIELHGVKDRACARHLLHQRRPNLGNCPTCEAVAKGLLDREAKAMK